MLVGEGEKSPVEWAGDWYQDKDMRWRFQPRCASSDHWFDPSTVPEPVRRDAQAALRAMEARMIPATDDQITNWLTEAAVVTGHKAADGQEIWGARYAVYAQHLSDIPADILRHAVSEHIKASVFFPKVSELRDRAAPTLRERRKHIERLRRLLGMERREKTMFESLGESLRMK